jgi:hypothetical protein
MARLTDVHALADVRNTQPLLLDHARDFQFEVGIELPALLCYVKLLRGWIFHLARSGNSGALLRRRPLRTGHESRPLIRLKPLVSTMVWYRAFNQCLSRLGVGRSKTTTQDQRDWPCRVF